VKERETQTHSKPLWLLIFLFAILGLVLFYGLRPGRGMATLYFLSKDKSSYIEEKRNVRFSGTPEERAQALLKEILLGPQSRNASPLFNGPARLASILDRGGKLHVDIHLGSVADVAVDIDIVKKAIAKSLETSLPGAGSLELYVNGVNIINGLHGR
jgi:hypothetical protein